MSCDAESSPAATDSATTRSRSGSTPPIGDRPALMASTFHPDDADARCTATTRAGSSAPSLMRAAASMAAIGIPTIPGPITPIFLTDHDSTRPPQMLSGIALPRR